MQGRKTTRPRCPPFRSKKSRPAKADPLATKLLADARAARAQWEKFPGFTADIEINFDGKISQGKVER